MSAQSRWTRSVVFLRQLCPDRCGGPSNGCASSVELGVPAVPLPAVEFPMLPYPFDVAMMSGGSVKTKTSPGVVFNHMICK